MSVTFEVERFEWAADDRLELEGRWFGLRGRRFIRPTLDVQVDGTSRRLLALMEHKPWAALDGEDWLAAFAWEGDRGDVAAELAVGSDMTFELPKPGGGPPGKASPKRLAAAAAGVVQPARRTRDDAHERKLADAERARGEMAAEVTALKRALGQKERTVRELQEQLRSAQADLAAAADVTQVREPEPDHDDGAALREELESVRADLAAVQADLAAAVAERDRLRTEGLDERVADGEREADLRKQRDAAIAARDAALGQAEEATRQRYEAAGALAAVEREVQTSARALEQVTAERDELRASARAARHERESATTERDDALSRLRSTRRERDHARLSRDAARAERPHVAGVAEAVRRRGPRALGWLSAERSHDELLALRFAALVALSVVCLLVAIWILLAA